MSRLISILLLFVFALSAQADVKIQYEHRVKNKPGGYCVYASIECIGNYYKEDRLYGLVDYYSKWQSIGAGSKEVIECLDSLEVPYVIQINTSINWLKEQVNNGVPIVVGCSWINGNHAIVVVDVTDDWVKYVDSNDIRNDHWVSRKWFEWAWYYSYEKNWSVKILR